MSNQAIYHFGSPFIDTIIKEHNLNTKDTVQKVKFEERLGGVCNSIDYASKLKIDTHLVISEKDELLIKSLLNHNKYISCDKYYIYILKYNNFQFKNYF